jgi:hypothetical protein
MASTDLEATPLEARARFFAELNDPIRLSILDQLGSGESCAIS